MNAMYGKHSCLFIQVGRSVHRVYILAEAVGQEGAIMQYKNFELTVVIGHGVDLVGWTMMFSPIW